MTEEVKIGCANTMCPLKGSCERYTNHPGGDPSVFKIFKFDEFEGKTHCDNFIYNKNLIYATDREVHSRS